LIKQGLGQGILQEVKPNQEKMKKAVEETLAVLLNEFFPHCNGNFQPGLKELIDKAVDLSNMMTSEKSLFYCEMPRMGAQFSHEIMNCFDDMKGEVCVSLCMFPAFKLKFRDMEGKDKFRCLVKAEVENGRSDLI
jgi:hypothetical protein